MKRVESVSRESGRRLYWDPTDEANAEAEADRKRLTAEFGIEFKAIDPEVDYFLGANRRVNADRSVCKLTATTYIEDMGKRFPLRGSAHQTAGLVQA